MKKTFVLDTSVLIHNPDALESFQDNDVRIPVEVIHEIDRLKTEPGERGRSARAVQRKLLAIFGHNDLTKPTKTQWKGTLAVVLGPKQTTPISKQQEQTLLKSLGKMDINDHYIIACAYHLKEEQRNPVILVTKDMGMMLKARTLGIRTEDYKNDKVENTPNGTGTEVPAKLSEVEELQSEGETTLTNPPKDMAINQYVLLGEQKVPAKHTGNGQFQILPHSKGIQIPSGIFIRPLNLGQQYLLDALLDPDISLVTVRGSAGTGKTILTLAAGLYLKSQSAFNCVLVTKPIVSSGGDLGALPGSLEEKMRPWLQPYSDALDILYRGTLRKPPGPQEKHQSQRKNFRQQQLRQTQVPSAPPKKIYDHMIEDGSLQIEALSYIRGRSIPYSYFILDEAQNVSPLLIKTVLTRIAKGSKIILLGDEDQIDNPYLDKLSNGLTYARTRMDNLKETAHIHLTKGERSRISDLAATLL